MNIVANVHLLHRADRLPTRADILAFIHALTFKEKTRHGKPSTKGRTLYFDKIHYVGQLNFIVKRKELKQRQGA
jgi:hypothetical protein